MNLINVLVIVYVLSAVVCLIFFTHAAIRDIRLSKAGYDTAPTLRDILETLLFSLLPVGNTIGAGYLVYDLFVTV